MEWDPLHAIVHIMWKVEVEDVGDDGKAWGKTKWEFANIYHYEADVDGQGAGFHMLVRDFRVPRMLRAHREPAEVEGVETTQVGTKMDFLF